MQPGSQQDTRINAEQKNGKTRGHENKKGREEPQESLENRPLGQKISQGQDHYAQGEKEENAGKPQIPQKKFPEEQGQQKARTSQERGGKSSGPRQGQSPAKLQ